MNDSADEILLVRDRIYKGGYEFGLTSVSLPSDHELFGRTVLYPPRPFLALTSVESREEDDEENMKNPIQTALVQRLTGLKWKIHFQTRQIQVLRLLILRTHI